ncbi:MAG TPA: hypothetical protein QF761_16235 [Pirellulales bacterium]|jgi:hypothetical protein|nr:hypothetical protein [Pirellulales bacterium]|tara:strand:- start:413 stop:559 length:147 start_codon:yes stop_codon:yes gene_type:complete
MHAASVYLLGQALELDEPGTPKENLVALYKAVREARGAVALAREFVSA